MLPISTTDRVFILTRAGVSAESGIPTFRGVNGLWRNYRIEEVASPYAWARDPRLVWEFYSMRRKVAAAAKPNPAHFALAKLEHNSLALRNMAEREGFESAVERSFNDMQGSG
jgi:NAD-dependent protein deacetylase/lipoamidase